MIRFAGVDLLLDAYGDVATHCERTGLDRARLFPAATIVRTADRNVSVGSAQPTMPLPQPNYPDPPPLKFHQLYWPTGATRFATFLAIVTRSQLLEILKAKNFPQVRSAVRTLEPQQLVIGDSDFSGTIVPDAESVDALGRRVLSVGMTPLEPQPVAIVDQTVKIDGYNPDDDLWILPLVDARYFYQWATLPARIPSSLLDADATVPETTTTIKESWDGWLRIIRYSLDSRASTFGPTDENPPPPDPGIVEGAPLGSSGTVVRIYLDPDPIDTDAWFFPDRAELDRPRHNAAITLDALAHSCGRRVVRDWSGHLRLIDPGSSAGRHLGNLDNRIVTAGGLRVLPTAPKARVDQKLKLGTVANVPFQRQTVYPEWVDVTFRKLVEFDDADLPDDVTAAADMPADYQFCQSIHGAGTRTLRCDLTAEPFAVKNVVPRTHRTLFVSSWVGRQWYAFDDSHETVRVVIDDGACDGDPDPDDAEAVDAWHRSLIDTSDTHSNQAAGEIDDDFYGDRYFRFAEAVVDNYVRWAEQRHAYCFPGFLAWETTGFDDHVLIDAAQGKTTVASVPHEFGVDTYLVQLHRQGAFPQDQIVGLITSQWTLHPKELERIQSSDDNIEECDLQTEEGIWKEFPVRENCLITDRFPWTWQWAEAAVRPLIPTDPWAPDNSIEYGRTMCWAGAPVVGVTRSRKVIDRLRELLLCDTLPTADAPDDCPSLMTADRDDCFYFDRTRELPTAHGVTYLRWNGCEWQFLELDCLPGATDAIAG